jgi:hypothetical protein
LPFSFSLDQFRFLENHFTAESAEIAEKNISAKDHVQKGSIFSAPSAISAVNKFP